MKKFVLGIVVSIFIVLMFSSCKGFIAIGATLAFLPELLFGTFMACIFFMAFFYGIIYFLTGGDKNEKI
jgi:hypothetical protein